MDASTASICSERAASPRSGAALPLAGAMMRLCALAVLLGGFAAATPAQTERTRELSTRQAAGGPQRAVPAPAASIFFCETADVQCRTELNRFELDGLRDLVVFVAWQRVSGQHTQQVRFILPDGNTYQVVETKFTTAAASAAAAARATGAGASARVASPSASVTAGFSPANSAAAAPAADDVQVAVLSRGEPTVITTLPVAGTHISQRSLAGAWTVEVSLDGAPIASARLLLLPRP